MTQPKISIWILGLVIAAAVLNGLLAGGNVDRALVAMPAWREVGMSNWADFSRHADLGHGQFIYPAMAIGGTLLSLSAAILFSLFNGRPRGALWLIVAGAALMIISLPISFKAAPFMLSLRHIANSDAVALSRAFAGFEFWGRGQGLLHLLAFSANLGTMIALTRAQGIK